MSDPNDPGPSDRWEEERERIENEPEEIYDSFEPYDTQRDWEAQ